MTEDAAVFREKPQCWAACMENCLTCCCGLVDEDKRAAWPIPLKKDKDGKIVMWEDYSTMIQLPAGSTKYTLVGTTSVGLCGPIFLWQI